DQAGALLQHPPQIIEVLRGHVCSPANSRLSLGAISSSGSSAEARPACATCPGMPQITLVASSCASKLPPAATIACEPLRPSAPMPVSISPSALLPHTCAAEANNRSTEGLQKLTGS